MTNTTHKRARQADERNKLNRARWLTSIVSFVLGTIFGLYVVQWFVALLPGPKIGATVHGLKATSGNAAGCTTFQFTLVTLYPIDHVYFKIQFPSRIAGYEVGFPAEAVTAAGDRMAMQAWEVGRNASGQCALIHSAINNTGDIQISASGNMIAVSATKLAPKSTIMGVAVTSEGESAVNPPPQMYFEGAYEYSKLGQIVRKPLHFDNGGVTEQKE